MPNPLDPEMVEEDSGRILISDEVLMTQILCKIKNLIREDIQTRERSKAEIQNNSSAHNSKSFEKKQRSQSRVLSPKRIDGIYAQEEVEIQDFQTVEFMKQESVVTRSIKEVEISQSQQQEVKEEISDKPKNASSHKSHQPGEVNAKFMVEPQGAEEEYDFAYLEAKKGNLWERLRKLMKKKNSLLEKKQKNDEIIEVEVSKLEIKKEQTSIEKRLLEE